MTTNYKTIAPYPYEKSNLMPLRWLFYLCLGISVNAGIWGLTFFYLKSAQPTYTSKWAVSLPVSGSSTRINIPELGGASSDVRSPFGDRSHDPREKMKFIAESKPVLKDAASILNMSPEELGKPRVKIVDNSTMMAFEIKGDSAEEAQQKGFAMHQAFQERLEQLRQEEVVENQLPIQADLEAAKKNLADIQRRLSEHKARTGLNSKEQVNQLSSTIEALRQQQIDLLAQGREAKANLSNLSANLKLSSGQAADAFVLKADQIFQQTLREYSQATAALTVLSSKYGSKHPSVVDEKSKQESAKAALLERSQSLLGRPMSLAIIDQLSVNSGPETGSSRENLLRQIVEVEARQEGVEARAWVLSNQIAELEAKLKQMSQDALRMEILERNMRIAETIYASTLTQSAIGRFNQSLSYPQVQLLAEPSLPPDAIAPKKSSALLGAAAGSFLISAGLFLLWLRPHLQGKSQPSMYGKVESFNSDVPPLRSQPSNNSFTTSNSFTSPIGNQRKDF
ncbi:hypothetical protein [Moorena sp. SIO4A5]|uniref:GumC family protein n=1 Tax=Moorena sp. SIO4A5 TaxID=2607838 RepID=UPI0013C98A95|nr:hypothetical protein [Moorena sp. SIO4A5]NEO20807.1 hypothetical protein [Moorena sp. SIO4A5]